MYLQIIKNKITEEFNFFLMSCMMLYIKILIIYFKYVENFFVNYYLAKNEDYDSVIKKIRANKICPSSIKGLYDEFYKKYSKYYNQD